MNDWKKTFESVGQWILFVSFLAGFILAVVIITGDVITSYHGWGVMIEDINPVLGNMLSTSFSVLPTLVQLIFWAGWTARSDIMSHNYFKLLFVVMAIADTIADLFQFQFFNNLMNAQLGKASIGLLVVVAGFGVLSEFMLLFCTNGLITQAITLKIFQGFSGSTSSPRPSLGPSIGSFVRGDEPIRPSISMPPMGMSQPTGMPPVYAPTSPSPNHRPSPGPRDPRAGPSARGGRP